MNTIPSLNGIRAASITLVFIAHAGASNLIPGGFGVTVFFFLSGFLITTLLRREFIKNQSISLQGFFIRRAYRILPPFYLALLFSYLLLALDLLPGPATLTGGMLLAAHIGNYAQIFFAEFPPPMGTGVYWSLAVEEHFYLFFPFLAIFLLKTNKPKVAIITLGLIATTVLMLRIYLVNEGAHPNRTYMATDTRIDSILFGCILAFIKNPAIETPFKITALQKWLVLVASAILLTFCFVYRDDYFRETYRYTIQGVALMPLFYLSIIDSKSIVFSWLNFKPIDFFGKLSYTFYLLHYVVIYAVGHSFGTSKTWSAVIAAFVTFLLSYLSYRYLELPIGRMRNRYRK